MAVIGTRLRVTALRLGFRTVFGLPRVVKRMLAGPQVRVEDQGLDLDVQLLYRIGSLLSRREGGALDQATLAEQRRQADLSAHISADPVFDEIRTRRPGGRRRRRLAAGAALRAGSRRYAGPAARLLPRRRLRAGQPDDRGPALPARRGPGAAARAVGVVPARPRTPLSRRAGRRARRLRLGPGHAAELGADPHLVAVGGDSAGGNLALVTAHERPGEAAFVLALYPVTDVERTGGSRDTFGSGYGLSADTVASLERFYLPDGVPDDDRRGAIVRADDLSAMPPVYLATAGFDPLRDEGEELAERLRRAGVPVTGRRFPGLVHGYAGLTAISAAARDATLDAASALRAGLALAGRTPASSTALTPGRRTSDRPARPGEEHAGVAATRSGRGFR